MIQPELKIFAKVAVAGLLAAVLGGLLIGIVLRIENDSWRAIAWSALGFGVLGAVLCFAYLQRLVPSSPHEPLSPDDSTAARTNRTVGYTLLAAFIMSLIFAYLPALGHVVGKDWFELFQSGFLFLAGALTTVIGYYFGNRGVQQVQDTATKAISAATQITEEVKRSAEEMEKRAKTEAADMAKPVNVLEGIEVPKI